MLLSTAAFGDVLITEINSKSHPDQEDFFELTNLGDTALDITGWRFDDESEDFVESVPLIGITMIDPGESVVFFQLDEDDPTDPDYDPAGEMTSFVTAWGGLAGVQVGYHAGSGMGKGDAATIFLPDETIVAQLAYGDGELTDPSDLIDDTHAGKWAGGDDWDSAIWVPGSDPATYVAAAEGVYGSFKNVFSDYGSPGLVPEPATLALLLVSAALVRGRR